MKIHQKKKKGFTLIELIIVLAILGILASIAVPKYGNIQDKAKKQADITNAKVIANAFSILVAQGTVTADISALTNSDACKVLNDYLQTIPTQQASNFAGRPFYVLLNMPEGEIQVYTVETAITGSAKLMLYPTVDSSYKD